MDGRVRSTLGALVLACACALAGCANDADLARPERLVFALGSARTADVVARFGAPQRTAEIVRNGVRVRALWYAYVPPKGEAGAPGEPPVRALEFDFYNDVLVGRIFASTFKSDSTDFDESLAGGIQKGVATVDEVTLLVGPPSAYFVPPLVRSPATKAVGYFFAPTAPQEATGGWTFRKSMIVGFDTRDAAVRVEVSTP